MIANARERIVKRGFMKKIKILTSVLVLAMMLTVVFVFVACNDNGASYTNDNGGGNNNNGTIEMTLVEFLTAFESSTNWIVLTNSELGGGMSGRTERNDSLIFSTTTAPTFFNITYITNEYLYFAMLKEYQIPQTANWIYQTIVFNERLLSIIDSIIVVMNTLISGNAFEYSYSIAGNKLTFSLTLMMPDDSIITESGIIQISGSTITLPQYVLDNAIYSAER